MSSIGDRLIEYLCDVYPMKKLKLSLREVNVGVCGAYCLELNSIVPRHPNFLIFVPRRRHGGAESYLQEAPRTPIRSQNRKPPTGPWQPTVPSWEKKFCTVVGSIPWRKLLEAQKVMYFYENVLQWNDSAGAEAFNNAKNRFWAEINGLPCDISLPDPNIYIDKIDWNSDIDPELLLDLERDPLPPDEDDKEGKSRLIGDSLFFLNRPVPCSGWGDAEEDPVRTVDDSSRPGLRVSDHNTNNADNPWEREGAQGNNTLENNPWGDSAGNTWESYQWENNNNSWVNPDPRNNGNWQKWNENYKKRDGSSQYMSRYKTSRFQGDNYQTENGWKNGQGRKRVNFFYDQPLVDKKPFSSQQWNSIQSCGPISHRGSREARNPWSWEKHVS
ncbi:hypothetical protein NE237_009381 [Protea cynaroides]|uniref:Uncharacterized protein n=1 Tax=Protea cynaroides TaxID=273540 RepID=A0A9Q0KY87_9MAGN|nr:hypothetical protein NE237_009381 [Protea cynaroides]